MDSVANVLFEGEAKEGFAVTLRNAIEDGLGRIDGDFVVFDELELAVHDVQDPDDADAPLLVMLAARSGQAATLYASDCDEVGEVERRVIRAFGLDDVTIDDFQEAVAVRAVDLSEPDVWTIKVAHTGDEAEAEDLASALLAADTLVRDYASHQRTQGSHKAARLSVTILRNGQYHGVATELARRGEREPLSAAWSK